MSVVEAKDVMIAVLAAAVAIVGIGTALMAAVAAFYSAFGRTYPLWLYVFFWVECLSILALALVSALACTDWLAGHTYARSGEVDGGFNVAIRLFELALFAVVVTAVSMLLPFVIEQVTQRRAPVVELGTDTSPRPPPSAPTAAVSRTTVLAISVLANTDALGMGRWMSRPTSGWR